MGGKGVVYACAVVKHSWFIIHGWGSVWRYWGGVEWEVERGLAMGVARLLWSSVIWRRPGGLPEDASSSIGRSAPSESGSASFMSHAWAVEGREAAAGGSAARDNFTQPSAPRTIRNTRDRPISRRTTISASNSTSKSDIQHGATPTQDLLIVCMSPTQSPSTSELGMALFSGSPGLKDSVCGEDMAKMRTTKKIEKAILQISWKRKRESSFAFFLLIRLGRERRNLLIRNTYPFLVLDHAQGFCEKRIMTLSDIIKPKGFNFTERTNLQT